MKTTEIDKYVYNLKQITRNYSKYKELERDVDGNLQYVKMFFHRETKCQYL